MKGVAGGWLRWERRTLASGFGHSASEDVVDTASRAWCRLGSLSQYIDLKGLEEASSDLCDLSE